jgi:hypothetical protein
LISGCSSDETGSHEPSAVEKNNRPPVVKSVAILPTPAVLSDALAVMVEAQDPDLNIVHFRYRWLVNGKVISGQTKETFPAEMLKRGDQIIVEVTPFNGRVEGAPFRSASVSVVNTAPIISDITIDVDHEAQGRQLLAKVDAVDPDNDPIAILYRWRKNGTVLKEGEEKRLEVAGLTAKDSIEVDVTASDGIPDGVTTVTQRFTLSNSAPIIVSSPSPSIIGNQYDYVVRATDADGDPLTYALDLSPSGMAIHAETGHIHWVITPELNGSHRVRVLARDPNGGFATQEFELSVKGQAKS